MAAVFTQEQIDVLGPMFNTAIESRLTQAGQEASASLAEWRNTSAAMGVRQKEIEQFLEQAQAEKVAMQAELSRFAHRADE